VHDSSTTLDLAPSDARSLRRLNVVVGLAHLVQAAAMLVLGNDLALPVTASFLTGDPVAPAPATAPDTLFSLRIAPAVAAFLLLAALDHLLVATPPVRARYEQQVSRSRNTFRWAEYSISASIMIVLIALLTGIHDVAALVAIFGVNSSMILFGLLMERQQQPGRADWRAFWFGSLAGAVPWIAIGIYFAGAATPPGFVYGIVATELVLFFSFAANMLLQYRAVGRWREYVFGERCYVWLSLTAKSLLAWLVFANVLRA